MKGDQADFVARLRLTLPEGWFGDQAPVLTGLLTGLGSAWESLFGLLQAVQLQSRLATVSGQFLDLACGDFFGPRIGRRPGEDDPTLRARLMLAMMRQRGTRAALIAAAGEAGYAAVVFEPARPADTGAYAAAGAATSCGLAWGVAGGWGSLTMPLTCFVALTATVPGTAADPGPGMLDALPAGGLAWVRTAG